MNFNDKQKKAICAVLAVCLVIPIVVSAVAIFATLV